MPTNMELVRLSNQLDQVKGDVRARVDRAKDDNGNVNSEVFRVKNPDIEMSMGEWLAERTGEAKSLQAQIDDHRKFDDAMADFNSVVDAGNTPAAPVLFPTGNKLWTIADEVFKNAAWDDFVNRRVKEISHDSEASLKALFETTTSGAANSVSVESIRTGDYVPAPRTRVTLLDVIPQSMTAYPVVKYDEEVLNLSNAGPIAQGAVYLESQFRIDEKSVDVGKSGNFIRVSEEALADLAELRARMNGSLMSQLYRRVQADIIGGAPVNTGEYVGGAPTNNANVAGFLDWPDADLNIINSQQNGELRNQIEVIMEAAEMVYRVGIADADAILMNSADWVKVETLQSTTGSFVLRGANMPITMPVMPSINGLPVVMCNALPTGTVIVGDFGNHAQIRDRQSVQVRIQEAQAVTPDGNNTVQTQPSGQFNIFADCRYAFYARRRKAFTKITNFGIAP